MFCYFGRRCAVGSVSSDRYPKRFYPDRLSYKSIENIEDEGIKLADLDLTGRKGVVFTFADIQASFTAKLNMPFVVNKTRLVKYFQEHPDEENVEFQYTLQYNDSDTGKMARFSLQKPEIQPAQARFVKTRGIYEQSGDLGTGKYII